MRLYRYIAIFLLTLLCGTHIATMSQPCNTNDATVSKPLSEQWTSDNLPNKELSLTSAQYITHFSEQNGISFQLRTHQSGGNSQAKSKSPFLLIKGGKTVDTRQHPFITTSILHLAGIYTADRYLYALRRIRV